MRPRTAVVGGIGVVLLAGCRPSATPGRTVAEMAKAYLVIAVPANHVLDKSFDALKDARTPDSATTALRTIVTTERAFDRNLLAMKLPPPMAAMAAALVRVNEARADLTVQALTATSPADLVRYKSELDAKNAPVEAEVRALRLLLHLPPPNTT